MGLGLDFDSTKHNRLQSQPKVGDQPQIILTFNNSTLKEIGMIQLNSRTTTMKEREWKNKLELIVVSRQIDPQSNEFNTKDEKQKL